MSNSDWSSSDDDDDHDEDESFSFHPICGYADNTSPTFDTLAAALQHDVTNYGFDLLSHLLSSDSDEFYEGAIITVNKARSFVKDNCSLDKHELGKKLTEHLKSQTGNFDDDANMVYFKPQLEDDAILLCIDELQVLKGDSLKVASTSNIISTSSLPTQSTKELQAKIELLEEQLAHAKKCIASFAMESEEPSQHKSEKPDNDTYYFSSYSNTIIHETMLRDTVRTSAYESAILSNSDSLFKGKTVLDIGCGTGVL
jgi:protein arginine N-methyltransferase 3